MVAEFGTGSPWSRPASIMAAMDGLRRRGAASSEWASRS
jgi:hypothetical protein